MFRSSAAAAAQMRSVYNPAGGATVTSHRVNIPATFEGIKPTIVAGQAPHLKA